VREGKREKKDKGEREIEGKKEGQKEITGGERERERLIKSVVEEMCF
jgi:hypothetical protein